MPAQKSQAGVAPGLALC